MKLDPIQPSEIKIFPESEIFLPPPVPGDRLIRINIRRNTLLAYVFSIVLHALLLIMVIPKIEFNPPAGTAPTTIQVSLAPPKQAAPPPVAIAETPVVEPVQEPTPEPQKKPPQTKPQSPKPPKVMTQPKSVSNPPTFAVPEVVNPPKPLPEVAKPQENIPPATDMQAYVKARQAARGVVPDANPSADTSNLSEEELRDQRIAKNLVGGAGGTFTLTSLDHRRATFAFNGWVNNLSNAKRQFFEVEATAGQDVRELMVKRIISFIRESYPGDFPWNSHRLGKVMTLSARPQDNSELEEFLMEEFFGPNYRVS